MEQDLTLSEVLADPLIAQVRQADAIPHAAFAQLLESAARVQMRRRIELLHAQRADAFYRRLDVEPEALKIAV